MGSFYGYDVLTGKYDVLFDGDRKVGYEKKTMSDIELAYCMKWGCEFDSVVVVLGKMGYKLSNKKLLYTAVTRGKNKVTIIDSGGRLQKMLSAEDSSERKTSLSDFLSVISEGITMSLIREAFNVLLPGRCMICGGYPDADSRIPYDVPDGFHICFGCLSTLIPQPSESRFFTLLSEPYEGDPVPDVPLYMPFPYKGFLREKAVPKMKFHSCPELASFCGTVLGNLMLKDGLNADVMVPVPLSSSRLKERGYNQAGLIATESASKVCSRYHVLNVPCQNKRDDEADWNNHCNTYSVTGSGKRPIYWLFDSGKQNGFKALIYIHRYTPDTVGLIRSVYLHNAQAAIQNSFRTLSTSSPQRPVRQRARETRRRISM